LDAISRHSVIDEGVWRPGCRVASHNAAIAEVGFFGEEDYTTEIGLPAAAGCREAGWRYGLSEAQPRI
jgi:hypothetical protein